jgi:transglutaminase-like putative cysteine protease
MVRNVAPLLGPAAACVLLILAFTARAAAPVEVLRADDTYELRSDGSQVRLWRLEIRPNNLAAARREAEQALTYSPSSEKLEVLEAATRKPDGRIIEAGPSAVVEQLPPGSAELDHFTDRRQKVVLLPDVEPGDTLLITWRRTMRRPILPGFATALYRPSDVPWRALTLTVRAPKGTNLYFEAHGFTHSVTKEGATVVHRWRADPNAEADDSDFGPLARQPRVYVSTWPNWDALAHDWAALALPKARPTPAIRALAARLVGGSADHREEAKRLYDWVSTHVRYVALYQADGALVPTDANDVLARGWGDCKDHVALFNALLAARGIAAEMVMVNLGDLPTLSSVPTFAELDHLISYLPEFDLYADTTAGTAPFGTLPFAALGKPVVHAVASGALRHTPPLAPGQASTSLLTRARLHEDGSIDGTTATTASGPFAADLRHSAQWAEGIGDSAAASQLRALGMIGSGSFDFAPPDVPGAAYEVNGRFKLDADPALLDGNGFTPPAGLRLLVRPGDVLLGPSRRGLSETTATACHTGRQTETIVLDLPKGRHLLRVPADLTINTPLIGYSSQWRLEGERLTVVRRLDSRLPGSVCAGDIRRQAAAALAAIRQDLATQVALSDE